MDALETLVAEQVAEEIEENSLWSEAFPMKLEDHDFDALAFELWREGSRVGWTPDDTPNAE